MRNSTSPFIAFVVSLLGVEPKKPRAFRVHLSMNFVEVFLSMDNAARVVDMAWTDLYFFKIDHKNGYQHVPTYEDSRKFFGCFFWAEF